jgi:hypothetical protein
MLCDGWTVGVARALCVWVCIMVVAPYFAAARTEGSTEPSIFDEGYHCDAVHEQ